MPIRFSDIAGFVGPPTAPRYHGGLARLGETIRADRGLAQRDEQLRMEAAEQAMQHERALQNDEIQNRQLDLGFGNLGLQRERFGAEQGAAQQKEQQEAYGAFVQAVSSRDPLKIEAAKRRLLDMGHEVLAPGGPPQPSAAPPGPPSAAAPMSPEEAALAQQLDAEKNKVLGALQGGPPQTAPVPARESSAGAFLSDGDALLKPGAPPPAAPQQAAPAPAGQSPAPPPGPPTARPIPPSTSFRVMRGGQEVLSVDPEQAIAAKRQFAAEAVAPLVAAARNPEEQRAASIATSVAQELVDGGADLNEAVKAATQRYDYELTRAGKKENAAIAASGRAAAARAEFGGTGQTKDERAVTTDDVDRTNSRVDKAKLEYGYKSLTGLEAEMDKIFAASQANNGFGDTQAIVASITALQERATDADFRAAVESGGLQSQLKNLFGYIAQGGRKDKKFMEEVRSTANQIAKTARATRERAAAAVRDEIAEMGVSLGWSEEKIEREANRAANMMSRGGSKMPVKPHRPPAADRPVAPAGGPPKAAPSPSAAPDDRLERAKKRGLLGAGGL